VIKSTQSEALAKTGWYTGRSVSEGLLREKKPKKRI